MYVYTQQLRRQIYPDILRFPEPCFAIYLCNKKQQNAQFLH